MAEEQMGLRRDTLLEWAPWTRLFSAFKVALDPKKLLLAGAGVLAMSLGWWLLAVLFWQVGGGAKPPEWSAYSVGKDPKELDGAWNDFKVERARWNKLYEMAGSYDAKQGPFVIEIEDVAESRDDYEKLLKAGTPDAKLDARQTVLAGIVAMKKPKPVGQLRSLPWFEDRGPNPYLLVTGKVARGVGDRGVPWDRGQLLSWLLFDELPVLLEPLVKFFRPVLYLFESGIGFVSSVYLVLINLWTLAVWAIFGGAITRMAAVQLARPNEKVSMTDAVKFAYKRIKSFFSAPAIPLLFLFILAAVLFVFGLLVGYTWAFGDILFAGLLWPLVLLAGLIMAVVVVGLVGWPLMYATVSTEGSDSFDAISRSYSYVYQAPWQYLWYTFVAIVYGAVLVFFVGLMGSLTIYLGKWGVGAAPHAADREQSYLFMYAPTSFGWRDMLLEGSPNVAPVVDINPDGSRVVQLALTEKYANEVTWNNRIGAILVSVWLYLVFLFVVGFGYSYFWTASTIIYLLMRRVVDDTEWDEVHLEEDEHDDVYGSPAPATPPATEPAKTPAPGGGVMVEAPAMRAPEPPKSEPPPANSNPSSTPPTGGL